MTHDLTRYARQIRYPHLGEEGQRRLGASSALVCGCGALGSVLADTLVRAGVGRVRIVDRDFVDTTNLHRQILFDEDDVAASLPKAVAAARKLGRINSQVTVESVVADVDAGNIAQLAAGVDAIVDGTDNFETRFLLNDYCMKHGVPWVYGGCLGTEGQTMTVLPGETPCLRCLMPECPAPGTMPTCDLAGVLGPIVKVIAGLQASEAIKILSGRRDAVSRDLTVVELWTLRLRQVGLAGLRASSDCPACHRGEYPWLEVRAESRPAVLCGRNAVQLHPHEPLPVSLETLAVRLARVGEVVHNPFLMKLRVPPYELTLFADGRAIVSGTDDPATARSLYARYVGT